MFCCAKTLTPHLIHFREEREDTQMTEDLLLGDRFRLETSEAEVDLPQRELLLTEVDSLGEAEEQLLLLPRDRER